MPPDSVRCTREFDVELASFRNLEGRSTIIYRTVRCASGATATSCQRSSAEGIKCATVRACTCRSQSRRYKAHRTVYRTCPVHHQTVRWPQLSEVQQSEPNGLVTWLAHRTVWCARRQKPPPTTILVVGAINTPNHPTFMASKFSVFTPHTRAIAFNTRHKQRDQILSQVRNHSKSNSD